MACLDTERYKRNPPLARGLLTRALASNNLLNLEGCVAFFIPLEPPQFLQKLVKWPVTIGELGDKSIKCSQHLGQFLNFFRIARWIKASHGIDLIEVDLYPPVSYQVTQEFARPYTEDTLLGVKANLCCRSTSNVPCRSSICWPSFLLFTTMSSIYTSTVRPILSQKHPRHHPLICGPSIFKPKMHHNVVVVGIRGDECRLFLVFKC